MNNSTISIPLSKTSKKYAGKYEAIIDSIDSDLAELNWCVHGRLGHLYAVRSPRINGKKTMKKLHRVILARKLERDELLPHELVDHIDGDGLNNVRSNLRLATPTGNARNAKLSKTNSTGYKGVSVYPNRKKKYRACIKVNKKNIFLGFFYTALEAHKAYCDAAIKYHGEFANFG